MFASRALRFLLRLPKRSITACYATLNKRLKDSLSFRLATLQDFDEVRDLSKGVFEGLDYLPGVYHEWLKRDNTIVMVANIDDNIIGLEAESVVDDGKTAVLRALRIHQNFGGHSYGRRLTEALTNHVREIFPNICRERFVTNFPRDTSRNCRELCVQHLLSCEIDKSKFQIEKFPGTERKLKYCTREYFAKVVLSSSVARNLFPSNTLLVDFLPLEALETNISHMLDDGDQLFVEECGDEHLPISFSHGRISPRTEFVVWSCSIFTQDPELFGTHLMQQIATAARHIRGNFIFHSFVPESLFDLGRELVFDRAELPEFELHFMADMNKVILYERDW